MNGTSETEKFEHAVFTAFDSWEKLCGLHFRDSEFGYALLAELRKEFKENGLIE